MNKFDIHLFWHDPKEDEKFMAHVDCVKNAGDLYYDILIFIDENSIHRPVGDDWIYCAGMFPLGDVSDQKARGIFYDNPANLAENIPQNLDREHVGYSYELEINDGTMTIYSDLDEILKINISVEDFKLFHKSYTYVRTTKNPVDFSITIW